jgi:hypothetical protein
MYVSDQIQRTYQRNKNKWAKIKICSTHMRYNPQLRHCRKNNEDTTNREEKQNVERTGELPHI